MSIDLDLDLNLFNAANRLFCVICPCNGIASNPKFLSNRATRIVLLQVAINTMNELPAISFNMCTKYTSYKKITQDDKYYMTILKRLKIAN